jgi:Holliday junction resolvasome RuvABC endonuclease subunit
MSDEPQPVLALDLATVTGWCHGVPGAGTPRIGVIRLRPSGVTGEAYGAIGAGMEEWLCDLIPIVNPRVIAFEAPLLRHKGAAAARIALGLAMIVETVAHQFAVRVMENHAGNTRKIVMGKGNPTKEEVVAWCRQRGWQPPTHDAADAAVLWQLVSDILEGKVSADVLKGRR